MKANYIDGVSRERVADLARRPGIVTLIALSKKMANNSATPKERSEYMKRTERARKLDPMVLVD